MTNQCDDCSGDFESLGKRKRCDDCTRLHNNKRARLNKAQAGLKNKTLVYRYLLSNPCLECGESDPMVLQFDHLPGYKKSFEISRAYRNKSWVSIQEEIKKCQVLCANCHQRTTKIRDISQYKPVGPGTEIYDPMNLWGLPEGPLPEDKMFWLK
jgi:hypothetical protein